MGSPVRTFQPGCTGAVPAAVDANTDALGIMIHTSKYARAPPTKPPGTTGSATQTSRTTVESMSRYSAIPLHTPAILESVAESISCLNEARCTAGRHKRNNNWKILRFLYSNLNRPQFQLMKTAILTVCPGRIVDRLTAVPILLIQDDPANVVFYVMFVTHNRREKLIQVFSLRSLQPKRLRGNWFSD